MSEPRLCRMFPLGSVLLPGGPLPLHIFETRYQQLLNETLEDDRTFGVVLITHGAEVGGGDVRAMVGTRAVIDEHQRFDDGRATVAARGLSRLEVTTWLEDDPYPRALVLDKKTILSRADDADAAAQARTAIEDLLEAARNTGRLQRQPVIDWTDAPEDLAWKLAEIAPIGALDRQRILEADHLVERFQIIEQAVRAVTADLWLMARLDPD